MLRSALLNVMVQAARKAARSLKRDFGEVEKLQVSLKGPANFVSAADKRAEEILKTELLKARPGYGFLGEEGGTTEGTDDPGVGLVGALAMAAFLAEEAVARPGLGEVGEEHLLGALVGERDEVRRALQRHLQMLDLAKIAFQATAGAERGLDHDVDEG
jgi:3'-phosphoadenosine 5'-phosphosulfate (PAPS) 3'-phosphatase